MYRQSLGIKTMATLSTQRQKQIDEAINELKLSTGLTYPENTVLEIVEAYGIKVFLNDFDEYPNINGIIVYPDSENKFPEIHINKTLSPERRTFTLAHELGHYKLHPGKDRYRVDKFNYAQGTEKSIQESEANYFAASLLVPKEKLISLLKIIGVEHTDSIADYFGTSKAVVENRINWIKSN